MGKLDGKIAILTGASRGIGRGIGRALAREGAAVVLVSRKQAGLDEAATELAEYGVPVVVYAANVADEAAVDELFRVTLARFGRLDLLVNKTDAVDPVPYLVAGSTYLFPVGKSTYKAFELVNPTTTAGAIIDAGPRNDR